MIVTAQGIAAIPLSFGILLNNNNNNNSIKVANKSISGIEQKVSHKLGRSDQVGATGGSSSSSKKNNIKSIKKILNNKLKVSHAFSGSRIGGVVSKMRFKIAIIKPTFTAAAYTDSFYKFYILFMHTPPGKNVTTDLNLLSSKIPKQLTPTSSVSTMLFLSYHLKKLLPQSTIDSLTDADVDGSSGPSDIFVKNGLDNKYDVLILGHQEYVTQKEYDNLKRFVANGGTLIALDGDLFHAEVKYDKRT
ncbi:MAG TPA: N,N-dimethylformamidase beta subunit family domain-containing protein, partial [Nitrososphaeraceae archaeon]|nr:N,N-dimethylformamidase beta subunit family domain-containing protein [Nitrososphaeraceae archaeon]